ncbi:small secreted hydrophilic protein [Streptomyces ferrugineus]|uniref:Small secreted hydrophilic protein n=1 Tax=Streptomyces ferrugineus TaxID=1413221 RepID=A0A7M2SU95_9ACTN|nr:small secreted hydrophilic protein [Streptomyces ferrugineus]QOV38881.1 small secreted hydrophilic protein [Streptomyces ferrugineus]
MVFSHRIAALAAVVAIPLGIAATSFALTDQPESPKVPPRVELDSGSPTPARPTPTPTPSDEVVSRPPVTDGSPSDDDDDTPDRETPDDDRGEPGDDG